MITRLKLLVLLARPAALMLFALCAVIGVAQARHARDNVELGQVFAVVFAFVLCCVAVNDLADERVDRVNLSGDRRRPLVTGAATRNDLAVLAAIAAAVAVSVSAWLGLVPLLVTVAGLVVGIGYSVPPVRLAGRGAVAALVLPACYVAVPYLVGYTASGTAVDATAAITLAGLYLGFIGRLLLKDFRDVRGDAMFGKRTFLVRHGRRATCTTSAVAWIAGTALLVLASAGAVFDATTVALTIATLVLLAVLSTDRGPRGDERVIAALAVLGRGVLLDLAAELGMWQAHWAPLLSGAILIALTVATVGAAVDLFRHGPRSGLVMPASGRIEGCSTDPASRASSGVRTPASRR
jgi:4-hydroxybenzoate polyprenyltransferase